MTNENGSPPRLRTPPRWARHRACACAIALSKMGNWCRHRASENGTCESCYCREWEIVPPPRFGTPPRLRSSRVVKVGTTPPPRLRSRVLMARSARSAQSDKQSARSAQPDKQSAARSARSAQPQQILLNSVHCTQCPIRQEPKTNHSLCSERR